MFFIKLKMLLILGSCFFYHNSNGQVSFKKSLKKINGIWNVIWIQNDDSLTNFFIDSLYTIKFRLKRNQHGEMQISKIKNNSISKIIYPKRLKCFFKGDSLFYPNDATNFYIIDRKVKEKLFEDIVLFFVKLEIRYKFVDEGIVFFNITKNQRLFIKKP